MTFYRRRRRPERKASNHKTTEILRTVGRCRKRYSRVHGNFILIRRVRNSVGLVSVNLSSFREMYSFFTAQYIDGKKNVEKCLKKPNKKTFIRLKVKYNFPKPPGSMVAKRF